MKEGSDAEAFIEKMTALMGRAEGTLKKEIERQIRLASYGLAGEKNIAFELKHSDMDMFILQDLYFEHNDLQAQVDFLIVTRKRTYIIECKNLIGNIEVDSSGNFVRTYELFGKKIKEGLYSPITQNERHKLVIKRIRKENKKNRIMKFGLEKFFDQNHKSIVVVANPKTWLDTRYAPADIKKQVIRADQLVSYIKKMDQDKEAKDMLDFSNKMMQDLADFYLEKNIPERSDYARKYEEMVKEVEAERQQTPSPLPPVKKQPAAKPSAFLPEKADLCPRCGAPLVLRTAKKGVNIGNQFIGCSAFPQCMYVKQLS